MKPTNPMAQLRQWKENNARNFSPVNQSKNDPIDGRKNSPTNERKIALVNVPDKSGEFPKIYDTPHDPNNCTKSNLLKNQQIEKSQLENHGEPKKKYQGKLSINPLAFKLTQLTRQFKLIQESNQKCFDVYPDDFHHKLKFRGELMDISDRLKAGGKLLNQLAKLQGVTFTRENQAVLRDFNQANGYLLTKFNEVIEQIDSLNLERVENEKLQGAKDE